MAVPESIKQLLPDARMWLRKSSEAFDGEICDTITAAIDDLEGAGVCQAWDRLNEGGVKMAVKLYLKANFGYGDPDGKYQQRYEKLRDALASRKG